MLELWSVNIHFLNKSQLKSTTTRIFYSGALSQVLQNVLGVSITRVNWSSILINNLLQPGGLDINSVIGSATSLLASLLAGDENFGKILGMYLGEWVMNATTSANNLFCFSGTGLDGFSGGGGAVNTINDIIEKIILKIIKSPKLTGYLKHMRQTLINETIDYFQVNNGQFVGQFLGTFIASLSAVLI